MRSGIAPKGTQPPFLVVKTDPDRWAIYQVVGAVYSPAGLRKVLRRSLLQAKVAAGEETSAEFLEWKRLTGR